MRRPPPSVSTHAGAAGRSTFLLWDVLSQHQHFLITGVVKADLQGLRRISGVWRLEQAAGVELVLVRAELQEELLLFQLG